MSSKVFGKRQTRPSASTLKTSPSANFVTARQQTTPVPDVLRTGAARQVDAFASPSPERAAKRGHNFANLPIYFQAKLVIGRPADPYEQEADRVASQVVDQIHAPTTVQSRPGQALQGEAMPEAEDAPTAPIQMRLEAGADRVASGALAAAINGAKGGGQPLAAHLQRSMGREMGAEFSRVKIHQDAQADQLNRALQAKAFTTGQDVFFRQGAYQPESRAGQALIAHELTHVVQQNGRALRVGVATSEPQIQRQISDSVLADGIRTRYRKRFAEIDRLKKWISIPKADVDATEVYKEALAKILHELTAAYMANQSFELSYISDMKVYKGDEREINNAETFINLDLEEYAAEIQVFWREVDRAYTIRQRLRLGAQQYRNAPNTTIPELYAGSLEEAHAVNAKAKTVFARLINDKNWFTDTGGQSFVQHAYSRSAGLGYSPAGEPHIPLHIGHRNRRD